jgi:hypothetical protein
MDDRVRLFAAAMNTDEETARTHLVSVGLYALGLDFAAFDLVSELTEVFGEDAEGITNALTDTANEAWNAATALEARLRKGEVAA